jgi:hypothetical protein
MVYCHSQKEKEFYYCRQFYRSIVHCELTSPFAFTLRPLWQSQGYLADTGHI